MTVDTVIFFISAAVAAFGATMMIAQRNPVASVLYMILSLVAQAVCYVQLGALFIGAVLVIVYAGAIMVLFLFVIMLLNLRGSEDLGGPSTPVSLTTKLLVPVLLVAELVFIVRSAFTEAASTGIMAAPEAGFGEVASVARLLLTRYLYPFELTGILLLVAIVGAVVMARRERGDEAGGTGVGVSASDRTPTGGSD
ncbi:MAG: NADH-quinone oxidoreductase subunit J [Candidatus Zixiibacteriota bacterium]|nr:MAG: NADH-quinone oxidoreductase subunit J [candidate division Zixibacteria bacterium]